MTNWDLSDNVFQCKQCGFKWQSLSLLWSWSYHCPWCGKLQPTSFLASEWSDLQQLQEIEEEGVDAEIGDEVDESENIPTSPGKKVPTDND